MKREIDRFSNISEVTFVETGGIRIELSKISVTVLGREQFRSRNG